MVLLPLNDSQRKMLIYGYSLVFIFSVILSQLVDSKEILSSVA